MVKKDHSSALLEQSQFLAFCMNYLVYFWFCVEIIIYLTWLWLLSSEKHFWCCMIPTLNYLSFHIWKECTMQTIISSPLNIILLTNIVDFGNEKVPFPSYWSAHQMVLRTFWLYEFTKSNVFVYIYSTQE